MPEYLYVKINDLRLMINLIFTDNRCYATFSCENPQLLPLNQEPFLLYDPDHLLTFLKEKFSTLSEQYYQHSGARQEGQKIPVNLGLPHQLYRHPNGQQMRQELTRWFYNEPHPDLLDPLFMGYWGEALAWDFHLQSQISPEKIEIVQAIDEEIFTYKAVLPSDDSFDYRTHSFPAEASLVHTKNSLLDQMLKALDTLNISLNSDSQAVLYEQLLKGPYDKTHEFCIPRGGESDSISVNTQITVSPQLQEQAFEAVLTYFQEWLSPERLSADQVEKLILIGEVFYHPILERPLLEHTVADKIQRGPQSDGEALILFIAEKINGLCQHMIAERERMTEKQRMASNKARSLEEQLAAQQEKHRKQMLLFDEIIKVCIHKDQIETYQARFFAEGEALDIPADVITWHIHSALASVELHDLADRREHVLEELGAMGGETHHTEESEHQEGPTEPAPREGGEQDWERQEEAENVSAQVDQREGGDPQEETLHEQASSQEKITPLDQDTDEHALEEAQKQPSDPEMVNQGLFPAPKESHAVPHLSGSAVDVPLDPPTQSKDQTDGWFSPLIPGRSGHLPSMNELFELNKWMRDPQFGSIRGIRNSHKDEVVLRLLKTEKLNVPGQYDKFQQVYLKDRKHFQWVTGLTPVKEGLIYMRPYIPGITLSQYIHRSGLKKKSSYKKLSTKDLMFLLKTIDAIYRLDPPIPHFNEDHMVFANTGLWGLSKQYDLHFVGFTSDTCPRKEMLDNAFALLSQHLQPGLFFEFQQKHLKHLLRN